MTSQLHVVERRRLLPNAPRLAGTRIRPGTPALVKSVVHWIAVLLSPVAGLGPTLAVVVALTLAEDGGHSSPWYVVVVIVLLNFLLVRLICGLLVTSATAVVSQLLNKEQGACIPRPIQATST